MDLLLELGPAPADSDGPAAPATVVGTMTRALRVRTRPGTDLVGVRFRPGGALPFLRTPARELVDLLVEAEELWSGADLLAERLAGTSDEVLRAARLDHFLFTRFATGTRPTADALVRRAATRLVGSGAPPVGALADALGVSRRYLERRFHEAVGVTPGMLRRVGRLRRAADILAAEARPDLGRAAVRAGYHDQPHMTRDFRELAGVTPGAWLAERSAR